MKKDIDDPRYFLQKVSPFYNEFFQAAYAIMGNIDLAGFVIQNTLLEAYLRRKDWRDRMSFREGVMYCIRLVGMTELRNVRREGVYEQNWPGFDTEWDGGASDGVVGMRGLIMKEATDSQRMLVLKQGCGLKNNQIAEVMQISENEVKRRLRGCDARLKRRWEQLAQREKSIGKNLYFERVLRSAVRQEMAHPNENTPDASSVFLVFESDVEGARTKRHSFGHYLAAVLCIVGVAVCAFLFWLIAILLESPAQPTSANAPTSAVEMMEDGAQDG